MAADAHRRRVQITERDRELLEFIAEQRLVLASHVQTLLRISQPAAYARLRALCDAGLLVREQRLHRQPSCYLVTRSGLAATGSELPAPRLDLRSYDHDVGLAWLALLARSGTFGPMREIICERHLRSRDARAERDQQPLAVRLGGHGAGGRERLHYPDLLLVDPAGRRIAVELELTAKGRRRREQILRGYAADRRVDVVLYLVRDRVLARSLAASARRLGISERVHVQRVRFEGAVKPGSRGLVAERARSATRTRGDERAGAAVGR